MPTVKDLFADLVAGTTVWKTQTSTATDAAAKACILGFGSDAAPQFPRMYVRSMSYRAERYAAEAFDTSGRLRIQIDYARVSGQSTRRGEEEVIDQRVQDLIDAIVDRSRTTGVLTLRSLEMTQPPRLNIESTETGFWTVELMAEWPGSRP